MDAELSVSTPETGGYEGMEGVFAGKVEEIGV
jgi:hypothetical protein